MAVTEHPLFHVVTKSICLSATHRWCKIGSSKNSPEGLVCTKIMAFRMQFCLLLLLAISGNVIGKKNKAEVHKVNINGQKDLVFLEGDNPCKVLKKYCKFLGPQVPFENCFTQLHSLVLKQLCALWSQIHKKLKADESFFIDCQPIKTEELIEVDSFRTSSNELNVGASNSSAEIQELLGLLERAIQRDAAALNIFNKKRNEYKLSDLDKLVLYQEAILMLPNNLFIVDQYGLSLLYLDKEVQARKLWQNAVDRGLWENPLQRPVSKFVKGLTSKPWHDTKDYLFIAKLEAGYSDIKAELLNNLENRSQLFTGETENLHVGGQWTELRLKSSGYGFSDYTMYFEKTMKHIKDCGQDFTSIKISAIQPGTHIRTHTGPSNERLRLHLTLIHEGGARIRVGKEWHTWEEGKMIMFDDSWEHEVLHTGHSIRVVLIMDIWHPELPPEKRVVH